ncbi:MAG: hypothetical protein ABIH76_02645 [Candidatus Bathyarchaeota archaeon]
MPKMGKTKTINVELPEDIYWALVNLKTVHRSVDWVDFFNKLTKEEMDLGFGLVSVDGEVPESHEVILELGKSTYKYSRGDFFEFQVPGNLKLSGTIL